MSDFDAVLGGTFDPVHLGHLHVVECVRTVFDPTRVLLLPCATPPHKSGGSVAAAEHRIAMLRLAIRGRDGVEISTMEIERGGVSFTIETLRALRTGPPVTRPVFVVGTDALAEIATWREYVALQREFDLIAVSRPGAPPGASHDGPSRIVEVPFARRAIEAIPGPPPGTGGRIFRVVIAPSWVSSSEIRRRCALGLSRDGLVPREVDDYIRDHRLYREEGAF